MLTNRTSPMNAARCEAGAGSSGTGGSTMSTCCPICVRPFNDARMLPCLHTFCLGCLQRMSAEHRLTMCPFCSAAIDQSLVLKKLPKNTWLEEKSHELAQRLTAHQHQHQHQQQHQQHQLQQLVLSRSPSPTLPAPPYTHCAPGPPSAPAPAPAAPTGAVSRQGSALILGPRLSLATASMLHASNTVTQGTGVTHRAAPTNPSSSRASMVLPHNRLSLASLSPGGSGRSVFDAGAGAGAGPRDTPGLALLLRGRKT
eukprot:m.138204 g.138204  ORF g.138204 m.138204 type:complete len:256 (-) comp14917_c1_seq2:1534-2301(-)